MTIKGDYYKRLGMCLNYSYEELKKASKNGINEVDSFRFVTEAQLNFCVPPKKFIEEFQKYAAQVGYKLVGDVYVKTN